MLPTPGCENPSGKLTSYCDIYLALGRIEDQYQFAEPGVIGETFLNPFTSLLFTIAFNTARGSRATANHANEDEGGSDETGAGDDDHTRAAAA